MSNHEKGSSAGFTREEMTVAKNISLSRLAEYLGFHPVRCAGGTVHLQEHDSLVLFNDRTWYRYSKKGQINGGTTLDFVMEFGGARSLVEAVRMINEIFGSALPEPQPEKKSPGIAKKVEKEERDFFFRPGRRITAICMLTLSRHVDCL